MNKARRKQINEVIEKLSNIKTQIEFIKDFEQDVVDNTPESLQVTDRFAIAEAAIENLDAAIESLGETINSLDEAVA
jgi:prefoldin subunit 5